MIKRFNILGSTVLIIDKEPVNLYLIMHQYNKNFNIVYFKEEEKGKFSLENFLPKPRMCNSVNKMKVSENGYLIVICKDMAMFFKAKNLASGA